MKRSLLVVALTLGTLSLALSDTHRGGHPNANDQSNQSTRQQAESSKQVKEEEKPVFDVNGKRFRTDERYIAQRTLQNGRIIAYRKNKREVAALVKALKEDGVTDKELLNPETWMKPMIVCDKSISSGCQGGCTLTQSCKYTRFDNQRTSQGKRAILIGYCRCSG